MSDEKPMKLIFPGQVEYWVMLAAGVAASTPIPSASAYDADHVARIVRITDRLFLEMDKRRG